MEKYNELDDPIQEVYRIRELIMKEFNYDVKAYHKYLRETEHEVEKAGFRYFTETELVELKNHTLTV